MTDQYVRANKFLKRAFFCGLAAFAIIILMMIFALNGPNNWIVLLAFLYTFLFITIHVYVGRAAESIGRSWIIYGLLPFVFSPIGIIISWLLVNAKIPDEPVDFSNFSE